MSEQATKDDAISDTDKAEARPSDESTMYIAESALEKKQYALAVSSLENILLNSNLPPSAQRVLHLQIAELWAEHLYRYEKATEHYLKAWHLDPAKVTPLQKTRQLYASLGQHEKVIQLLEMERDTIADPNHQRRAEIEVELGERTVKLGKLEQATIHLERAMEAPHTKTDAMVALAEIYSSQQYVDIPKKRSTACLLFIELALQCRKASDTDQAIEYLERALVADPHSTKARTELETSLTLAQRWKELDNSLVSGYQAAATKDQKKSILRKRIALYLQHLSNRQTLKDILAEMATLDPPGNEANRELREVYKEDGDWDKLIALIERDLPAWKDQPKVLCQELLHLATIVSEHKEDKDKSSQLLHQVLTIDPGQQEAILRYSEYFRERRDWRGLVDLQEFHFDNVQRNDGPKSELLRILEEIATLSEKRLGDMQRAITAWQRVGEMDPGNSKAPESLKRLSARVNMWQQLVGVLEKAAEEAQTPKERAEALRRIAQTYRERRVNPRKTISLFEQVWKADDTDVSVLAALLELYEREGDDEGVVKTIRRQIQRTEDSVLKDATLKGEHYATAKDWPVAKRVERLTALRRIAKLYERNLADVDGVVFACSGILEIIPGDRDALHRMERTLEKAKDTERLKKTLNYHANISTSSAEKARIYRRLATMAGDNQEALPAIDYWEKLLGSSPNDVEAMTSLIDLYGNQGQYQELAQMMDRKYKVVSRKAKDGDTETTHNESSLRELVRCAKAIDTHLDNPERAIEAWKRVRTVNPTNEPAVRALARLYEQAKQPRELADALASLSSLCSDSHPQEACNAATQRADILRTQLGLHKEATRCLEFILRDLDPAHKEAHKSLCAAYLAAGNMEKASYIMERQWSLENSDIEKSHIALQLGELYNKQLHDPHRALQAYARVLEVEATHVEAIRNSAEIYKELKLWKQHTEKLLQWAEALPNTEDKCELWVTAGKVFSTHLGDYKTAFHYLTKAQQGNPDASVLSELRHIAEDQKLWPELCSVYQKERMRLQPLGTAEARQQYISLSRDLAHVYEAKRSDPLAAIGVVRETLHSYPTNTSLLEEVFRIATDADTVQGWESFLECLFIVLEKSAAHEKVRLYLRSAEIYDTKISDLQKAEEALLQAFSWEPQNTLVQQAISDHCDKTNNWEAQIAAVSALASMSPDPSICGSHLQTRASLLEEKSEQPVRAFRTLLSAFLLHPKEPQITSNLWRLAEKIGTYDKNNATPGHEPRPAYVQPFSATKLRQQTESPIVTRHSEDSVKIASKQPVVDPTHELSMSDLLLSTELSDSPKNINAPDENSHHPTHDITSSRDTTNNSKQYDSTIQLRTEDLLESLHPHRTSTRKTAPPIPKKRRRNVPPPPPPPLPRIQPSQHFRTTSQTTNKRNKAVIPSTPIRRYDSPWEELATAYNMVATKDPQNKRKWLFAATDLWENGAKDIAKAFDTLAHGLRLTPTSKPVRSRLVDFTTQHDQSPKLASLYLTIADEATSTETAITYLLASAEIRTEETRTDSEQTKTAETLYRRILGIDPLHATARTKLEQIFRDQNRWADLAASLEERTNPRLGVVDKPTQNSDLLRELADIYSQQLNRTYDAIETLSRLTAIEPTEIKTLLTLVDLYKTTGNWRAVIDTLTTICELQEGTPQAAVSLQEVARIYEEELELPDRAIEAYQKILQINSDDQIVYQRLASLYKGQKSWENLSSVIAKQAALASSKQDRAQLLRRRARILRESMGDLDQSIASLRMAKTLAPDDNTITTQFVSTLVAAEKFTEAAAVLEEVLQNKDTEITDTHRAHILAQLAELYAHHLDADERAKELLAESLALAPEQTRAIQLLTELDDQQDPASIANAKYTLALKKDSIPAQIPLLLEAASIFHKQAKDLDSAQEVLEQVLTLQADHPDALWAIASLHGAKGNLQAASQIIEENVLTKDTLSDRDTAEAWTRLSVIAKEAQASPLQEEYLRKARDSDPTYFLAIEELSSFLADNERIDELATFVEGALLTMDTATGQEKSRLLRRLAGAHTQLGHYQDAYNTLLDADRHDRNNLPTKLAMGSNRFAAKRWREAAMHLSAISHHSDAKTMAKETAHGLYQAALAEKYVGRPDKSHDLLLQSITFHPHHLDALEELARIASKQGDKQASFDYLVQKATSITDSAEKVILYTRLGDMAIGELINPSIAADMYEKAVTAADPIQPSHTRLLEKLLSAQIKMEDNAGAAKTSESLAALSQTEHKKADRLMQAAEKYLEIGDAQKARVVATEAVATRPRSLTTVTMLSDLMMQEDNYREVEEILEQALATTPLPEMSQRDADRTAKLWLRLGHARMANGDSQGAIDAFSETLSIGGDSATEKEARQQLVPLLEDGTQYNDQVIVHKRILATESLVLGDIVTYARACYRSDTTYYLDLAKPALEVATHLGHVLDIHDAAFLNTHRLPRASSIHEPEYPSHLAYKVPIDNLAFLHDQENLGEHNPSSSPAGDCHVLTEISEALCSVGHVLWPDTNENLVRQGIDNAVLLTQQTQQSHFLFPQVAKALDVPNVLLYETAQPLTQPKVVCSATPIVVLPRFNSDTEKSPDNNAIKSTQQKADNDEIRFTIGRSIELARPRNVLATGVPTTDLFRIVSSVVRLFGPKRLANTIPTDISDAEVLKARDTLLLSGLPVRTRSFLTDLLKDATPDDLDIERYIEQCHRTADRAGVVFSRNAASALRLTTTENQPYLMRFVLSDDYVQITKQLRQAAK